MTSADEHTGLRYMTRFQCLGSACEDPCCYGWRITVDDAHAQAIAAALGDTDEGRRAMRRLPVVDQAPHHVADMALDDRGRCVMLEETNLCSLHRRFGEEILADQCATYPRTINRVGAGREMSGATSCPEVARLCLLAADAVDVVPLEPARFVRDFFTHELADRASERLLDIRGLVLELLRAPYPLSSCHMFVAAFALHTASYTFRGAAIDHAHLDASLARFRAPQTLDELHRRFTEAGAIDSFAVTVVLAIVDAERWPRDSKFGALVTRVKSRYAPAMKKGALDPTRVATMLARRRDELPAHLHQRLELHLRNAAINDAFQDWHVECPSLLDLVSLHLAQHATIRFLVLSHPDTTRAGRLPPAQGLALLDATTVACVSSFSRAAHHSNGLGARIMQKLSSEGLQTAAHLASLARL
jgi:lysine-N-methylase